MVCGGGFPDIGRLVKYDCSSAVAKEARGVLISACVQKDNQKVCASASDAETAALQANKILNAILEGKEPPTLDELLIDEGRCSPIVG